MAIFAIGFVSGFLAAGSCCILLIAWQFRDGLY